MRAGWPAKRSNCPPMRRDTRVCSAWRKAGLRASGSPLRGCMQSREAPADTAAHSQPASSFATAPLQVRHWANSDPPQRNARVSTPTFSIDSVADASLFEARINDYCRREFGDKADALPRGFIQQLHGYCRSELPDGRLFAAVLDIELTYLSMRRDVLDAVGVWNVSFAPQTWARAAGGNRACLAGQRFKKAEFLRRFERLSNDNALVDRLACQLDTPKGARCAVPGREGTQRDVTRGPRRVQWPAAERRTSRGTGEVAVVDG